MHSAALRPLQTASLWIFAAAALPAPRPGEELAQETFIAVLRPAARYQPSALFRTLLYAVGFKFCALIAARPRFGRHFWANSPLVESPR